mgnify:FL=1
MELKLIPIPENGIMMEAQFETAACKDMLHVWKEFYPKIGFNFPWIGYFIQNDANMVVGTCALILEANKQRAEISYFTFSEFEGLGIATNACKMLINIARQTNLNIIIFAKTAPEKNASVRILEKNRFIFHKIVTDHEIGEAWEWVLKN